MQFSLSKDNGDAAGYVNFLVGAVEDAVFAPWSVLVLDNAKIHTGVLGKKLEDWLWNYVLPDGRSLRMLVVFLPTRFFELNPQELVFAFVANKSKSYSLIGAPTNGEAVPLFAARAFSECTVAKVERFFRKCGYVD